MIATDEINIVLKFMEVMLTLINSEHFGVKSEINTIVAVQLNANRRDCCI